MRRRQPDLYAEPLLVTKRKLLAAGGITLLLCGATTFLLTGNGKSHAGAPTPVAKPAPEASGAKEQSSRRVFGSLEYQAATYDNERAGYAAFRRYTDDFCDALKAELEAQMEREHLTEAEVRELTYFAMLAKTSLDWDGVEEVTGHAIHPNARRYTEEAMVEASQKMKHDLREKVAAGADEKSRRETIDRIEREYLDQYNHLTGMDDGLLDYMLWQYVQEHPSQDPVAELDVPTGPGEHQVNRHLNELPPPPPPPPGSEAPPPPAVEDHDGTTGTKKN